MLPNAAVREKIIWVVFTLCSPSGALIGEILSSDCLFSSWLLLVVYHKFFF